MNYGKLNLHSDWGCGLKSLKQHFSVELDYKQVTQRLLWKKAFKANFFHVHLCLPVICNVELCKQKDLTFIFLEYNIDAMNITLSLFILGKGKNTNLMRDNDCFIELELLWF